MAACAVAASSTHAFSASGRSVAGCEPAVRSATDKFFAAKRPTYKYENQSGAGLSWRGRSQIKVVMECSKQSSWKDESRGDAQDTQGPARFRGLAAGLALTAALVTGAPDPALSEALVAGDAAKVFATTCAGCHFKGGNVVQAGATLSTKDLERNNVNNEEAIYKLTYFGKGKMPGYGAECKPRGQCTFGPRLSDWDIHALSEFVLAQAEKGWQ